MIKPIRSSIFHPLIAIITIAISCPSVAQDSKDAVKIMVERAKEAQLYREVPLNGTVVALQHSTISAEVEGIVAEVAADAGDRVDQNELIVQLKPELGQIAYDSAVAEFEQTKQAFKESERLLLEAKTLAKQKNIADSEVDARAAQVGIDDAAMRVAEAQKRLRKAELQRHSVLAPFAGVISKRLVNTGQWITPGTPVVELVDTNHLRLDFQVPQRFYRLIDDNSALLVSFDAGEEFYPTDILKAIPVTSADFRSFLLTAEPPENAPQTITGMSVTGLLKLSDGHRGITVHRDAVLRYPDGRNVVWTVSNGQPKQAEMQKVEIGLAFEDQVEIKSGLQAGQQVIVEGNESIAEGQIVAPKSRQQAAH